MKTKKLKDSSSPSQNNDLGSLEFPTAAARIAVAQICQSVGFRGAQNSALETLTDVAVRYLRSLAKSAAASAHSTGRMESNLLDIIRALEELHSDIGFHGNSDPNRRLYLLSDSSVLRDTMKFVYRTREIPFAKPLPRHRHTVPPNPQYFSNGSTKWNHIPRWLPAFPNIGDGGEITVVATASEDETAWQKKLQSTGTNRETSKLPEKRKKVSFKIGRGGKNEIEMVFGVDLRSGVCKGGKRISCQIYDDDDENYLNASSSSNHGINPSSNNKLEEAHRRAKMILMN